MSQRHAIMIIARTLALANGATVSHIMVRSRYYRHVISYIYYTSYYYVYYKYSSTFNPGYIYHRHVISYMYYICYYYVHYRSFGRLLCNDNHGHGVHIVTKERNSLTFSRVCMLCGATMLNLCVQLLARLINYVYMQQTKAICTFSTVF